VPRGANAQFALRIKAYFFRVAQFALRIYKAICVFAIWSNLCFRNLCLKKITAKIRKLRKLF